jgi:hypothetical protein
MVQNQYFQAARPEEKQAKETIPTRYGMIEMLHELL